MRLSLNRKQVSCVDTCSNATLCLCPFLKEGRVSVSTPSMSCPNKYATAFSASASVLMTNMRPSNTARGNATMSLKKKILYMIFSMFSQSSEPNPVLHERCAKI